MWVKLIDNVSLGQRFMTFPLNQFYMGCFDLIKYRRYNCIWHTNNIPTKNSDTLEINNWQTILLFNLSKKRFVVCYPFVYNVEVFVFVYKKENLDVRKLQMHFKLRSIFQKVIQLVNFYYVVGEKIKFYRIFDVFLRLIHNKYKYYIIIFWDTKVLFMNELI